MSFITEKLQKLSDFFQKRIIGIKTSEFIILIDGRYFKHLLA